MGVDFRNGFCVWSALPCVSTVCSPNPPKPTAVPKLIFSQWSRTTLIRMSASRRVRSSETLFFGGEGGHQQLRQQLRQHLRQQQAGGEGGAAAHQHQLHRQQKLFS